MVVERRGRGRGTLDWRVVWGECVEEGMRVFFEDVSFDGRC